MNTIPTLTPKQIKRFWSNVTIAGVNDCWLWTGSGCKNGRGLFSIRHKTFIAARVAYAIAGNRSNSLYVLHNPVTCNNPACVNPKHLRFGTKKEDANDMRLAGTMPNRKGCRHGRTQLTDADVIRIRQLAGKVSGSKLASMYNLTPGQISHIVTRRSWTHLP
jgi:hypothetical protein